MKRINLTEPTATTGPGAKCVRLDAGILFLLSAVATFPAIAFFVVVHGTVLAGLFAIRLVRCKTYGANHCCQN